MSTYRTVMWISAGGTGLLHLVLLLRTRNPDWLALNVMMPAMFVVLSRPQLAQARLGLWFGIAIATCYAVGTLYLRVIRDRDWPKLYGFLVGIAESLVLAAACGWGTRILPE